MPSCLIDPQKLGFGCQEVLRSRVCGKNNLGWKGEAGGNDLWMASG